MKNNDINSLMKHSLKSPSKDFTDKLMNEINTIGETKIEKKWTMIYLSLGCILIFVLSFTVNLSEIMVFNYNFQFPPIIVQMAIIIFILYELNQLIGIYRKIKQLEKIDSI